LAKDAVLRGDSVIAAHYYKQALKQPVPTIAAATATATDDTAATVTASTNAAVASDNGEHVSKSVKHMQLQLNEQYNARVIFWGFVGMHTSL
jgi:hypothetical protein